MLELSEQSYSQRQSKQRYFLYAVAAVASIFLSIWINVRESVINPDAICYLLSAQTMTEQGFKAGMQFCPQAVWPFYSFLLSQVAQLTHLSYQLAANLCDGFFTLISVLTFIAIIETLGATRRVLWLAAAVILFSHEFNFVRQYIVRDHGFWAFYLLSMFFMVRYFLSSFLQKRGSSAMALAWAVSIGIATLFRIEGAIFMLTLPFAAFFSTRQSWPERFKSFAVLNSLTIIAGAGMVAWLLLHPENTMAKLGRVHEVFDQMQSGWLMMAERYQAMRSATIEHVLTLEAARDASLVLVLTLLFWYLLNVIGNLSWIYSALVVYAWYTKAAKFARPAALVLAAYLLMNLIVTACFFAEHLFLAKRYLIAFSLTLMIWVPYALDQLIKLSAQKHYKPYLYAAVLMMAVSAIGGIFDFGYSKTYIRQAGTWIASHVPADARLYVNDLQLMYYSEYHRSEYFKVKPMEDWKQYDYIALRLRHGENKSLPLASIVEFANKRGDKVIIYKASSP